MSKLHPYVIAQATSLTYIYQLATALINNSMTFSSTFLILLAFYLLLVHPIQAQQDQIPMSNDPSEQSYRRERPEGMSKSLNGKEEKQPTANLQIFLLLRMSGRG